MHFLLSGMGRSFYIDARGRETNKFIVRSDGAFASLHSLLEHAPSPFSTEVLTDCCVAAIAWAQLIATGICCSEEFKCIWP